MIVGTCTIDLRIEWANSLKDKRHVIKSIIGRVHSRFNVAIAEVELQDHWREARLGMACVTNDTSHAYSMLENIVDFIERDNEAELTNYTIEII